MSPDLRRPVAARLRDRRPAAVLAILALTLPGLTSMSSARPPSAAGEVDAANFVRIEADAADVGRTSVAPPRIADFRGLRSVPARPTPSIRVPARVVVVATPRPKPQPAAAVVTTGGGSHRVSGKATWYCLPGKSACHHAYSGGMYAAAGSEIRIGNWRGRTVRVCSASRCISVKLIDWCACAGTRVIDLYSDAFRRLAPLSQGAVAVTVSW